MVAKTFLIGQPFCDTGTARPVTARIVFISTATTAQTLPMLQFMEN